MIRVMQRPDEAVVRELYRVCHPTWSARPPGYFTKAHTTLVAETDGAVIGYAVLGHTAGGHAYAADSGVHPDHRAKGIAFRLHEARMKLARQRGAEYLVGATWADNKPMVRLLESLGFLQVMVQPNYYPENDPPVDGLMFVRHLKDL